MSCLDILKHIGYTIRAEMGFASDQIIIWNQKNDPLKDDRTYVSLSVISDKVFANNLYYDKITMAETIITNHSMLLGIDVYSRNIQALADKDLIVMSLRATISQFLQNKYGYYIASIPQQINTINEGEGAAILYRFNMPIQVYYVVSETKDVDYYDNFYETEFFEEV